MDEDLFKTKLNIGKIFYIYGKIYERWINIIDCKDFEKIALSIHMKLSCDLPYIFSNYLRINGEDKLNYMTFAIENIYDYNKKISKSKLIDDLKIKFSSKSTKNISENHFNGKDLFKERKYNFNYSEKGGIHITENIKIDDKIIFERLENIINLEENKIKGERLINKLNDLENINSNRNNKVKKKSRKQKNFYNDIVKSETKLYKEKIFE